MNLIKTEENVYIFTSNKAKKKAKTVVFAFLKSNKVVFLNFLTIRWN